MVERAVIIAVGSSTHQSQLAYSRPRAMLPVLGKPLVVRIMEPLYRAGIQRYTVVVGEDEGGVAAYLNRQWLPNVQVEFVIQPHSTGLLSTLADITRHNAQPFLVAAYNSFVHANFPERLLKAYHDLKDGLVLSGAPTTLSKFHQPQAAWVSDQRVIQMGRENRAPSNGQRSLLLTNLAVCGASVIQRLPDLIAQTGNFSKQLLDVLKLYHEHGGATYMAETNWILPIEADYDLLTVNRLMLDEELDNHILSEVPASVHLIPPVRIDPHVSVGQGARIGPHVYLEAGCSVGAQAVVRDALVLQNATVPAGKTVRDVIVASRVQVRNPG